MDKHISKVLKVFIYKGVCSGEYVEPIRFNDYDIVITSYTYLNNELNGIRNLVSIMSKVYSFIFS